MFLLGERSKPTAGLQVAELTNQTNKKKYIYIYNKTKLITNMSPLLADLKAQTAAVETRFVHGGVLLHKAAAQVLVLQGVQLAAVVVVDQLLGEMEKSSELAKGAAVRLHLRRVVVNPEEGVAVTGGNVTGFVDDVQKASLQDLKETTG